MIAHAFDFDVLVVQEKALVRIERELPYTKRRVYDIEDAVVLAT